MSTQCTVLCLRHSNVVTVSTAVYCCSGQPGQCGQLGSQEEPDLLCRYALLDLVNLPNTLLAVIFSSLEVPGIG